MNKELLINRIISGTIILKVDGHTIFLKRPSATQLYEAEIIYTEALEENIKEGLYSDEELYELLLDYGYWDETREKLLETLPKEIEEFKIGLFKSAFKSNEKKSIRKYLKTAKDKLESLISERHEYDYLSARGAALLVKSRFIMSKSSFTKNGKRLFKNFWACSSELLDKIIYTHNQNRIPESDFRLLARTDPWRGIWNLKKAESSLFGIPAMNYTEEQKNLVGWTNLYDSIFEHSECPSDEVIEDDDVLDGWLLEQKRKRGLAQKEKFESVVTNEKIRNCAEIFIPAETPEDAVKINDLNSEHAKVVKKQRQRYLNKQGEVNEAEMPDVKRDLMVEFNRLQFKK